MATITRTSAAGATIMYAAATFASVGTAVLLAGEPARVGQVSYGWALAATLAAVQLVWNRHPTGALLLSAALVAAHHLAGLPAVGLVWPLLVPYLRTSLSGAWRAAATLAVAGFLAAVTWRTTVEGEDPLVVALGELQVLAVVGLVLAVGEARWQRQRREQEVRARLAEARARTRLDLEHRLYDQRLAVAADLHDVTAHGLVVIGLQLRNAEETVDIDPEACRSAIASALRAHDRALEQTTSTVRMLRSGVGATHATPRSPTATLSALDQLVETAAAAGVVLEVSGGDVEPSRVTSLVAYRICQEAVTNTLRHAGATRASLRIRTTSDSRLHLTYEDDGRFTGAAEGLGLRGMKERAAGIGGRVDLARAASGGLLVQAWLPTGRDTSAVGWAG